MSDDLAPEDGLGPTEWVRIIEQEDELEDFWIMCGKNIFFPCVYSGMSIKELEEPEK